jgi:hypothetical protein
LLTQLLKTTTNVAGITNNNQKYLIEYILYAYELSSISNNAGIPQRNMTGLVIGNFAYKEAGIEEWDG